MPVGNGAVGHVGHRIGPRNPCDNFLCSFKGAPAVRRAPTGAGDESGQVAPSHAGAVAGRKQAQGTSAFDGHCSSLGRGSASAPLSLGASRHSRKPAPRGAPEPAAVARVRNDPDSAPGRAASAEVIDHQARAPPPCHTRSATRTPKWHLLGLGRSAFPKPRLSMKGVSRNPRRAPSASLRDGLRPLFTEPVRRGGRRASNGQHRTAMSGHQPMQARANGQQSGGPIIDKTPGHRPL